MTKGKTHRIHPVSVLLIIYDYVVAVLAYGLGLWLRFDCSFNSIDTDYLYAYYKFILFYGLITVIIFAVFRLYRSLWKYASYMEARNIAFAMIISSAIHMLCINFIFVRMPISYHVLGFGIQLCLTVFARFIYRFLGLIGLRKESKSSNNERVMIIGAGAAGRSTVRELRSLEKAKEQVVCFIDQNKNKWGKYIDGVQVVGGNESILEAVEYYHVSKIYITIPSASKEQIRDLINICKETGCAIKTLPRLADLIRGESAVAQLRNVAVEDLLGRDPIRVDLNQIMGYVENKVILVTGGGGSIGSELCRQIATHNPKKLIIFDVYENNAYEIQQELKKTCPELEFDTIIGSVRDSRKLSSVFETYKPQIVYHAAAHKHVPLMEDSPCEAIKNNAIGTYKTAYAAMVNGCERFVLISTDKAVNPTNIMGASKRLCEMVVQSFDRMVKEKTVENISMLYAHAVDGDGNMDAFADALKTAKTEFVAVRFGNVLGSNGSVIPLFKKQIEVGGPVTVTHPDIIRYFMTIPEAVSLVLQAGAYAKGGEIFVLDMGEPVKIDDLARNLIKLSGFTPDEDIKIEYTGLRPGEKLYEEKLMEEEGLQKTDNKMIHIGNPIAFDEREFLEDMKELMNLSYENSKDIRECVKRIVKTYHPENMKE